MIAVFWIQTSFAIGCSVRVSSAALPQLVSLQKQFGYFNHRVATLVADKLERQYSDFERFALILKTNCVRQPKRQLPSSSYNHNTLTALRTSVRESPACTKSMEVPYFNFEVHL